jgi:hypothetical protein
VRARQLDELIIRDALSTSGTSMKAVTDPFSAGHSSHATDATSPQKYCGLGCTVS